jgi:hypothetical protein
MALLSPATTTPAAAVRRLARTHIAVALTGWVEQSIYLLAYDQRCNLLSCF